MVEVSFLNIDYRNVYCNITCKKKTVHIIFILCITNYNDQHTNWFLEHLRIGRTYLWTKLYLIIMLLNISVIYEIAAMQLFFN